MAVNSLLAKITLPKQPANWGAPISNRVFVEATSQRNLLCVIRGRQAFQGRGFDLWGGPGKFRGSPGNFWGSLANQKFQEGALEKGYLHKIVRNQLSNSRQIICDNFAHPCSDVRYEIQAILRKFGAQFATNFCATPPGERPLLGISEQTSREPLD